MRKIITSIVVGMAMILGITGSATAAPSKSKSVCDTGHRGQKAYDAKCLKTGKFKNGSNLWLSIDEGTAKRENVNNFDRRSLCKFSSRFGGIKATVREAVWDVAYDSYRNNGAVANWSVQVAKLDCASMGYKIK